MPDKQTNTQPSYSNGVPHLDALVFQYGSLADAVEHLHRDGLTPAEVAEALTVIAPPVEMSQTMSEIDAMGDPDAEEHAYMAIALLHAGIASDPGGELERLATRDDVLLRDISRERESLASREEIAGKGRDEILKDIQGMQVLRNDLWRQAKLTMERQVLTELSQRGTVAPDHFVEEARKAAGSIPGIAPERQPLRTRLSLDLKMEEVSQQNRTPTLLNQPEPNTGSEPRKSTRTR